MPNNLLPSLVASLVKDKNKKPQTARSVARGKSAQANKPKDDDNNFITVTQLMRLSLKNEPDNTNAKYVHLQNVKTIQTKQGTTRIRSTTITRILGQNPRKHEQRLTCKPVGFNGKASKAPGIIVWCDCMRFDTMWRWVLWNRKSAPKNLEHPEPPNYTNPVPRKLGCCKHLCVLLANVYQRKL